jgi:hypothetical protein
MLSELVKKLPAIYGTRNFIIVVKTADTSTYFMPEQASFHFPSRFPTKGTYAPLISAIHNTFSTYPFRLDLIARTVLCRQCK